MSFLNDYFCLYIRFLEETIAPCGQTSLHR